MNLSTSNRKKSSQHARGSIQLEYRSDVKNVGAGGDGRERPALFVRLGREVALRPSVTSRFNWLTEGLQNLYSWVRFPPAPPSDPPNKSDIYSHSWGSVRALRGGRLPVSNWRMSGEAGRAVRVPSDPSRLPSDPCEVAA